MAYRDKAYIAFDGDEDIRYYNLLKAWAKNKNIDFDFKNAHDLKSARDTSSEESIKRSLKDRMNNSKVFVLLLGEHTKNLYKFIRWEIDQAIKLELPIIVVNLNNKTGIDSELLPPILVGEKFETIPFKEVEIQKSLKKYY